MSGANVGKWSYKISPIGEAEQAAFATPSICIRFRTTCLARREEEQSVANSGLHTLYLICVLGSTPKY